MKTVIFLDDGISYFTDSIQLHKVHGRLWDEGIPIALAVIPAIRGINRVSIGGAPLIPGIPAPMHNQKHPFRFQENQKLCNYFGVMAQQRLIEICIHGYHASYDEFASDDDVLLTQKIEEAKSTLATAIPDADLTTFVVPEESCSATAFQLLAEYDFHIVTQENQQIKAASPLAPDRKQFQYGEIVFSPKSNSDYALNSALNRFQNEDVVIIRQPHWVFFDEDGNLRQAVYDVWQRFLDELLKEDDVIFDTFSYV